MTEEDEHIFFFAGFWYWGKVGREGGIRRVEDKNPMTRDPHDVLVLILSGHTV